jgi:hypothetical protein
MDARLHEGSDEPKVKLLLFFFIRCEELSALNTQLPARISHSLTAALLSRILKLLCAFICSLSGFGLRSD